MLSRFVPSYFLTVTKQPNRRTNDGIIMAYAKNLSVRKSPND